MKENAKEMERARLEAIKILDNNPNCTEKDFHHIRHIIDNDTIEIFSFDPKPFKLTKVLNSEVTLYKIYDLKTKRDLYGSTSELAEKLGLTYAMVYNGVSGLHSRLKCDSMVIDVIPKMYGNSKVKVYELNNQLDKVFKFEDTYCAICKMFDIDTSCLWQMIENEQIFCDHKFELGDRL